MRLMSILHLCKTFLKSEENDTDKLYLLTLSENVSQYWGPLSLQVDFSWLIEGRGGKNDLAYGNKKKLKTDDNK